MKEGDYGQVIGITLKDANGDPYDLTGKTVQLIYRLDSTTYTKTMTVISAEEGEVSYTFLDGDLPSPGELEYEVVVTASGVHLTSETIRIDVTGTIS